MKSFIKNIYPYVIIIVLVVIFRNFVATPVRVDGDSMDTALKNGQILILNKLDTKYNRFEIVVVKKNNEKLIKRIIGLPGEAIKYKDNELYINGKKMKDVTTTRTGDFDLKELYDINKIPNNYYFVMGDNRTNSLDSRDYRIGLINKSEIQGTVKIRLFPFTKIGKV